MSFLDNFLKDFEKADYLHKRRKSRPFRIIIFSLLGIGIVWAIIRAYRIIM